VEILEPIETKLSGMLKQKWQAVNVQDTFMSVHFS